MEKIIVKETYRNNKPGSDKKRTYKPRKKKEEKFDLDKMFLEYEFTTNNQTNDLYFYGVKK